MWDKAALTAYGCLKVQCSLYIIVQITLNPESVLQKYTIMVRHAGILCTTGQTKFQRDPGKFEHRHELNCQVITTVKNM